jgi:hypothetical protein
MVDVFISYSRTNREIVERLAEAVRAEGFALWWDEELPPHLSYGDVITEKIGSAKAAIVVWSKAAAASEWVRAEADVARNQKKLIQVSVDGSMPPLPFNQIQFASLADWQGEADHSGWRKVKASLNALCRDGEGEAPPVRRVAAAPPAAPPPSPPAPRSGGSKAGWIVAGLLALITVAATVFWLARRGPRRQPVAPGPVVQQPAGTTGASGPGAPAPGGAPGAGNRFALDAVIEDPDGYTNVRSGPSAQAPIVGRVEQGEVFQTFRQPGVWWRVRTAAGTVGFMHRSRIRPAGAAAPSAGTVDPPQVLADSSVRPLSEADLSGLGPSELRIARNEIYARRGRTFLDPRLRQHFSRYSWYAPRAQEVALSPVEQANVRLIEETERAR